MKSIINLFWGICLLRQSPAVLPGQPAFVTSVVLANIVVSLVVSLSFSEHAGVYVTLNGIIVSHAVTASLVWLVLSARGLTTRFTTALAALLGCDLVITACFGLALPLLMLLGSAGATLGFLSFLLWSIAVAGYILHHAAGVRLAIGIGLGLGLALLSVSISRIAIGA
jgi:hypothetical protein